MMSDRRSEVAALLHKWATEEMNFVPQGRHVNAPMPTTQELRGICRGSLLDIWEFVITRVHSAQTARKIKGNLALQARHRSGTGYKVKYKGDSKYSHERAELLQRRRELKAQLEGTKSDIKRLSGDLGRLELEILSAEHEYQDACSEISDLQHKQTLLGAHSTECKANTARYEEYTNRITGKLNHYMEIKSGHGQSLLFSKQGSNKANGTFSPGLESACTKVVRESCSEVAAFLRQILKGDFGSDSKALTERQNRTWASIENVLADHPSDQVIRSLAVISEESAHSLRRITNGIDLKKDAEQLRFKHGSSGLLEDASTAPDLMLSVHQLIEEKQLAHMRTFMVTEQSRNTAWRLDKRLAQLVSQVHRKLDISLSNQPGALEMARTLFSAELELVSSTAALEQLRDSCKELQEWASKASKEKDNLYSKYQQIQDFKKLTEKKQDLIRVLVRQNSEAKKKLEILRRENLMYMQSSLCSHEAGTVATATQMKNGVTEEVERFAQLPLHLLRLVSLDSGQSIPVSQLSINRFSGQSQSSGGGAITEVVQLLKYPPYKAPETLLPHAVQLKCEITAVQTLLDSKHLLHTSMAETHTDDRATIQNISALTKEVSSHDEEQLRQVLPVLQTRLSESTDTLASCISVKDALTAWWEQPAQHLTPWVRLDDLTLQQWLDKWTVAVTRLRQLGV
ncbi:HAUS augmin-like complex subunit 5 [Acanthaster planci]|uniref:HAUS augmin-like complex subunit 5 n=1 Tax=Acanthaster planci TaxID=133434 RepID=A0A8B7ZGV9_ACAPL|nr:HAUS augmin-like complex subunit 5 [Acanthaster planci]XP_022104106.1 HAUS augmin-like complex subunit 5 [Acanthaster planci]